MPYEIRLTPAELDYGEQVGRERYAITSRTHLDAHGLRKRGNDPVEINIEGAKSELAFSVATGVEWIAVVDDFATLDGDVGPYGIRSTTRPNGGLLLHPSDNGDRLYFLVLNQEPVFVIRGWISGEDGKRREWWRTDIPNPAFLVPQQALWLDLPDDLVFG